LLLLLLPPPLIPTMAANSSISCGPFADDTFGPVVDDCVRTFDFTLLFEESILAILPSALLLLAAPVRLFSLCKRRNVVGGSALLLAKLVSYSTL
jgi:ATP-binding cassette, subfamily C (CFTR/MRP), member 1